MVIQEILQIERASMHDKGAADRLRWETLHHTKAQFMQSVYEVFDTDATHP